MKIYLVKYKIFFYNIKVVNYKSFKRSGILLKQNKKKKD